MGNFDKVHYNITLSSWAEERNMLIISVDNPNVGCWFLFVIVQQTKIGNEILDNFFEQSRHHKIGASFSFHDILSVILQSRGRRVAPPY